MNKFPEWFFKMPWEIIKEAADKYDLDPFIIAAIIMVESSGNHMASRFEPTWTHHLSPAQYALQLDTDIQSEMDAQATSYGYMQVMGTVAREYGFGQNFTKLYNKKLNIDFGCKHLKNMYNRYGDMQSAIASYNAGSVIKTRGGTFVNERYVDKVMSFYREIKGI